MRTRGANKGLAPGVVAVVVALFFSLVLTAKPAYAKTFTVNSTGDANGKCEPFSLFTNCSLREAINAANSNDNAPILDTIAFNIQGSGVQTLTPDSELPPITEPVTIDGYTQRPCSSNPAPCSRPNTSAQGAINSYLLIELDGSDAGSNAYGLNVEASNTLIKGLIINFGDDGIDSPESAKGLKVKGNLLGTDNLGGSGLGNIDGVDLDGNNTIVGAPRRRRATSCSVTSTTATAPPLRAARSRATSSLPTKAMVCRSAAATTPWGVRSQAPPTSFSPTEGMV